MACEMTTTNLLCHRGRGARKGGVPNGPAARTRGCRYELEGVREARAAAPMMVTTIPSLERRGEGMERQSKRRRPMIVVEVSVGCCPGPLVARSVTAPLYLYFRIMIPFRSTQTIAILSLPPFSLFQLHPYLSSLFFFTAFSLNVIFRSQNYSIYAKIDWMFIV